MNPVNIREMLECGVHFGHPTRRWNPKMKKYIFGERNGISIIDLQKTARYAKKALDFVRDTTANGGKVLFVGTKRQAFDVIRDQAERSESYFVNHRWLGGFMTNYSTIQQSVRKLDDLEKKLGDEKFTAITKKKELGKLEKNRVRMDRVFCGIRDMKKLPSAVFVVDIQKEHLAVAEARKLNIPVVAIVDTNCDPDNIDYIIPGNDDAIRALGYFSEKVAEAAMEGAKLYEAVKAEEEAKRAADRAEVEKKRAAERKKRDAERKARDKAAAEKKAAAADAEKKPAPAKKKAADTEVKAEAKETATEAPAKTAEAKAEDK